MRKYRVYVAGPYTAGDQAKNVRRAIDAGEELLRKGFAPYVPHYTHFWHMFHPHTHEEWLALDFEWLGQCDAVLRLPGESRGADLEVADAELRDIPVFTGVTKYAIEKMVEWRNFRENSRPTEC